MYKVSISCSWCHEMNEVTGDPVLCSHCGHRADVSRMECDCSQCKQERLRVLSLFNRRYEQ